ncbi:hypothetical protein BLNAU_19222 [Blattamonas nauphoetae]|uniref:Uncharacterized protein n=1 Tax=Blattamonas nauphoetae TaxID=2049346 RepID=A0ABQ9X254_9EUKA|nr:hypothetical protein BLNAU_19222 [Blattamonas nauphoetae]
MWNQFKQQPNCATHKIISTRSPLNPAILQSIIGLLQSTYHFHLLPGYSSNKQVICLVSALPLKNKTPIPVLLTLQPHMENGNVNVAFDYASPSPDVVNADLLSINADDRKYIQISKQLLQYEMKRRRIYVPTISFHSRREDDETSLPASITSDWHLNLPDSITIYDLQEGCISLFDQVNSGMELTSIEINYAVRFLEYACIHIKHRDKYHNQLLEFIYPEETHCQTQLVSSLINLLSLPSDTLQTAVLSFLDVGLWNSKRDISVAMAVTGVLPQLFQVLKPHEIALNDTTMEFHRHLTSIVDYFFRFSSPESISNQLQRFRYSSRSTQIASTIIEQIFESFCTYLQYLLTTPVSPTGHCSGFTLLSNMKQFRRQTIGHHSSSSSPSIRHFFRKIRKNMMEELVSMLGLASSSEAEISPHSDQTKSTDPNQERFVDGLRKSMTKEQASLLDLASTRKTLDRFLFDCESKLSKHLWVVTFERLLARVSEGKQFSDLGVHVFRCFMSRRPDKVSPLFWPDKFEFKLNDTILSSSKLDSKSLWTLFTPTQPHHAATILDAFGWFLSHDDNVTDVRNIWNEWFPCFINAVDPSKLPFTVEFIELHTTLIQMVDDHLTGIRDYEFEHRDQLTDQLRIELDELFITFYKQSKNYIVHLSLHPFALDNEREDTILDFLIDLFRYDWITNLDEPLRAELRREMDTSALSSSSPPFIITSEIACDLTDKEFVNVVDRIVALLDSDSCLDDDTILQICTFIRIQLSRVYLPDLFRNAGRSTEQYFHAFESLLSLHIESFERAPIHYLLTTRPDEEPTLDEWDDVDLERVGIVKRMIDQNQLSMIYESKLFEYFVVDFGIRSLPQARHCATRLSQPQLERLLAPSIDSLGKFFIQPRYFESYEKEGREKAFVNVCKLCDQRVVAQCVSRIGFFSRVVIGLFNENIYASDSFFHMIIDRGFHNKMAREDRKAVRSTIPCFLEEGWQDALDLIFIQDIDDPDDEYRTRRRMQFFGTNGGTFISPPTPLPGSEEKRRKEGNRPKGGKPPPKPKKMKLRPVHVTPQKGSKAYNQMDGAPYIPSSTSVSQMMKRLGMDSPTVPRTHRKTKRMEDSSELPQKRSPRGSN